MKKLSVILGILFLFASSSFAATGTGMSVTGASYNPVAWDLLDTFHTSLPAGSVNGTLSDSGHVRTVVDTESKLSITGGNLLLGPKAAPGYGDPGLWSSSVARAVGKILISGINSGTSTGKNWVIGFDVNQSGSSLSGFHNVLGEITARDNAASTAVLFTATNSTNYQLGFIVRNAGYFYFVKGGTFTNWSLLYSTLADTTATLYPATTNNDSTFTSSYIAIPSTRWLPTPLLSHGFASVVTPSDGAGHAETTGLGSGGSGAVMTGATWSMVGGKAVNTPTEGEDVIVNGTFDTDASWGKETGWTIDTANSNVAEKTSGASGTSLSQVAATAGVWYSETFDLVSRSAGTFYGVWGLGRTVPATYTTTGRAISTTIAIYGDAASVGTVDNYVVKPLTLSELFLTSPLSTSNVVASANLTITAGTQAGLGLRLDSAATPTKGLVATNDGTTCKLDEFTTATTWNNRISGACTYSAGTAITAITDGTDARLYYNNALINVTTSITGTITGTIHGLFSTSALNSIDNLVIYPRGNEGQFSNLEAYVLP